MGRTVAELSASIDINEMAGWIAFHEIEPFGPRRQDQLFGELMALIYNVNRGQGQDALSGDDIYPDLATYDPGAVEQAQADAYVARLKADFGDDD